ncbi:hypothetical protein EZV62_020357 [Acer yangbiense]|uniref:Cytochrome P450 n=1 Tax=Acer yangbiense TaxID=1000413 RepID=A0A5C7HDW8_9ROSI|nr:hypothetical protein EZV62_020357 [Acer yangbiense]
MLVFVLVCVVIISIAWSSVKLLHTIWWRPKMIEKQLKKQGIHGYPYRLMHGNTKEMMKLAMETNKSSTRSSMEFPHDILPRINPLIHSLATTHKKAFVVWYGTTPRVAIMEPKLIKEILLNKFGEFPKTEINSFTKLFATGLASYDGHKWSKHRKIINPAFHFDKLKQMLPAFSTCTQELIEKWEKLVNQQEGCCELDVSVEFLNLTGDVISRAAFGSNFEEGRLIFLLQKEQGKLFLQSMRLNLNFPLLRFAFDLLLCSLRNFFYNSNMKELQENQESNAGMTTEDVIEECKLFYFAGQETTANLLTWSIIALSMHQDWQERAREEVLTIFGKNKPTSDDLNHLKIVNMILLEVLRLYPPTSLIRRTTKKTKLGDFYLPAGVQLFIPLHIVHRDPEQWGEDALEFNPERFAEGIAKASKDQVSYFPFGWGPRICIGQNFAMLEAKLALSQILQHFSFELAPTYTHAPSAAITLQPQYGAQIILHKL